MKKLLSVGLMALCAFAMLQEPAHAWVNSRFSIGLNWHHQSANTSYLWGLWRNGQVPGPEAFGAPPACMPGQAFMPGQAPPGAMPFPWTQGPQPVPVQQAMPQPAGQQALPVSMQNHFQHPYGGNTRQVSAQQSAYNPNYSNPYQTMSYPGAGYYPPSAYNHPYYQPYYNHELPYYWYTGR